MEGTEPLRELIARQRALTLELEEACRQWEGSDLIRENQTLKAELETARTELAAAKAAAAHAAEENTALKHALYEQIYSERLKLLGLTRQKLDLYFQSACAGELNRLTALERATRRSIDDMVQRLRQYGDDVGSEARRQLDELSATLDRRVSDLRGEVGRSTELFRQSAQAQFDTLGQEPVTEEMVRQSAKKNHLERFVGLNLLNKLGILLILIGVVAAGPYTYYRLPDALKVVAMFLLGVVMLAGGEVLSRRRATVVSLGVTAGGVAVLYAALATSYFWLGLLGVYPALGLCLLITACAFLLATRYRAQVVLAFALLGGYLPLFALGAGGPLLYGAMVYFVALNLLALLISFHHRWTVSTALGVGLNVVGSFLVVVQSGPGDLVVTLLYVLFAFLVYTLIPVVGTHRTKARLNITQVVLLSVNTFFGCLMMYFAFYRFSLGQWNGLLALGFAAVYLCLGWLVERKFAGEKELRALFYLTGFAFVVLVIPLQLDRVWLSLGWLVEGVSLAVYGILRRERLFRRSGLVVCALCLGAFLLVDAAGWQPGGIFPYQYTAITLGSLALLWALARRGSLSTPVERGIKYGAVVNLWLYAGYLLNVELAWRLSPGGARAIYLCQAGAILAALVLAWAAPRVPPLRDRVMELISVGIYGFTLLRLAYLNTGLTPLVSPGTEGYWGYFLVGTAVLVALGLLSVLGLYDLVRLVRKERSVGEEWLSLLLSGYFVLVLTQVLITQYGLRFSSALISVLYAATALGWIVFGFVRRYAYLRRFGLGLAVLSVAKLFLVDLYGLTSGYRIVSYLVLGAALVGISFVYQHFNRRLELTADVKKDD